MAYKLDPAAPLDAEFRRIAGEQLRRAERVLVAADGDPNAAVHEARKRLKKLRGLTRLVRDARPAFHAKENARYRDLARSLSGARDSGALVEALDRLADHYGAEVAPAVFEHVRSELMARREAATTRDLGSAIEAAARSLGAARHKLDGFVIAPKDRAGDAATIIAEGFARTHDRARSALATARKEGDDEALHELRKRVKYHWMHLRLIAPLWPDAIAPLTKAAKAIADGLGLDHDYSVMRQEIAATPEAFGTPRELAVLAALIDRRQAELRVAALDTARRLLADDPDGVRRRVKRLYRAGPVRGASDPGAPVASPLEVLRQAE
ncbi:CHAD domain-containing protein [Aurantimonas litoralis]|nr:CHAD domain-containing protein [Aurantimonas litoralis]